MTYPLSTVKLRPKTQTLDDVNAFERIESEAHYLSTLKQLQKQLAYTQQAYYQQHRRAIIVFEGWDASGKGGTIRRLTERLDARGVRVHPINRPTEHEQGKHYLYRFYKRLPAPGNWAIFDRSYYGRVLVERVEALASPQQWQRGYQEINEFERLLVDDGVRIVKLFMHITQDEQKARFLERLNNPFKRWKLSHEDLRNRSQWSQYWQAINAMLAQTDTEQAPWHIIPSNHKWYARITALQSILAALQKDVDTTPPDVDASLVLRVQNELK